MGGSIQFAISSHIKHSNIIKVYLLSTRVYNRKEGEYPTHYSTVYHPFTGVSDLSSIIHNLWFHTTPLTTTMYLCGCTQYSCKCN